MQEISAFESQYWQLDHGWKVGKLQCPWNRSELNAAHRFVYRGDAEQYPKEFAQLAFSTIQAGIFRLPFERTILEYTAISRKRI